MAKLMQLKDEKTFSLRGRALECMGHIAIAVGKDTFRPYFQSTMQCACEGLTFESTDLHEFAYAAFANLSKVMGDEFSPVLQELVPHLITVISQDEGQLEKAEEAQVRKIRMEVVLLSSWPLLISLINSIDYIREINSMLLMIQMKKTKKAGMSCTFVLLFWRVRKVPSPQSEKWRLIQVPHSFHSWAMP